MALAIAKYTVEHVNFIPILEMFVDAKGFVSILAYYKTNFSDLPQYQIYWLIPFFTYQIETAGLLVFLKVLLH